MTEGKAGNEPHSATASAGTAAKLQAQLGAVADKTRETIDSAREPIADRLLGAADTLRARGGRLPRRAAGIARGAADRLEASATYLVTNSMHQMLEDVLSVVKEHPAQALLLAGAMGFVMGLARRKD
jgi:ElaB/YqjD/DUF883 family membrane-anchored ribosome-binding protein